MKELQQKKMIYEDKEKEMREFFELTNEEEYPYEIEPTCKSADIIIDILEEKLQSIEDEYVFFELIYIMHQIKQNYCDV